MKIVFRRDPTTDMYYRYARQEMLPFMPADAQRVLELGCAEGVFAATVKERTGAEVWGIEFNPQAAERARAVIDRVLVGDADTQIAELPDNHFDAVVCNDVLEHLVDPVATLKQLRTKLKPGGVVVASIPNIRYAPALSKVVFVRTSRRTMRASSIARICASSHTKALCDCSRRRDLPCSA